MPNRGEVWMVDLGLAQKTRPALIRNRAFKDTDRALVTVIPHTLTLRGSEFEIRVSVPFLKSGAFLVQTPVTVASVKAERFLGRLTPQHKWRWSRRAYAIGLDCEERGQPGRVESGLLLSSKQPFFLKVREG